MEPLRSEKQRAGFCVNHLAPHIFKTTATQTRRGFSAEHPQHQISDACAHPDATTDRKISPDTNT